MLLLILLAVLALILFGVGAFVVHWLLIVAAIVALIWVISMFTGGFGRAGYRRW